MMKVFACLTAAAVVAASVGYVKAAELQSGLQAGEQVGAFTVEKCGGANSDGKEEGSKFCYRCMLGQKPVVMIFARKSDDQLASLVKAIDKEIPKHRTRSSRRSSTCSARTPTP